MEIPAWMFFSLWALIGVGSLFLGINALDRTDLATSISPIVMFFFKHSLAISACHSSTYALVFRTKLRISVGRYYMWASLAIFPILFGRISGESFAWYFPIYSLFNIYGLLLYYFLPEMRSFFAEEHLYKGSVWIAFFPLLYFASSTESFGWYFSICGNERFRKWLCTAAVAGANRIMSQLKKKMRGHERVVEFAIGMAGTILFQNYFHLKSLDHVVAFLYLAVAWLSNLAMLLCPHDFGIFNFFLSNVIVGSTVSEFGLRGTTWFVYGASLLLYIMRVKLQSLSLVKRGEETAVIVWLE